MKKIISKLVLILVVLLLFVGFQRLVTPKYMDGILEGSFIKEYYEETTNNDVVFIGDCELYENFSPIRLWEDYGITSFIRGSAQQLIWQSYYLLEDTIRYEKPKVVVFNVLSMKYNEPQREEYNRMSIDGMKWSMAKVNNIKASMTEGEQFLDYVFPLLRYHSRITSLTKSDFTYLFNSRKITHNGYYMRVDVAAPEDDYGDTPPESYEFGDNAWLYLNKLTALCKEEGIELLLVKAPSLSPIWYDEYEEQIDAYAKDNDLQYINYLELVEELSIDYTTDTYDEGLHMNLSGAEKLSMHLGKVLQESYGLPDHRNDEKLSKVWNEKVEFYNAMEQAQYDELEEYGYLVSFGGENPFEDEEYDDESEFEEEDEFEEDAELEELDPENIDEDEMIESDDEEDIE